MKAPDWPADHVERRAVSALIPYARNARTHSEAQVAQIAASIREWGWTVPVLVDEGGTLIAGHGRVLAAQKLGIPDIPVMVARGWTEAQRRAYVLADNKLALNAGWDSDLLRVELAELAGLGADLALTGFAEAEISDLLGAADLMDPMDGGDQTRNPPQDSVRWGTKIVPVDADEVALLNKALDEFVQRRGVAFGFVRGLLGEV